MKNILIQKKNGEYECAIIRIRRERSKNVVKLAMIINFATTNSLHLNIQSPTRGSPCNQSHQGASIQKNYGTEKGDLREDCSRFFSCNPLSNVIKKGKLEPHPSLPVSPPVVSPAKAQFPKSVGKRFFWLQSVRVDFGINGKARISSPEGGGRWK